MAKLSKDDVLKLAQLARLRLSDDEVASFQSEINNILGYVVKLQAVDVDGLEPTIQIGGQANIMRQDTVKTYQASPKDLLEIAPSTEGPSLKVSRVL